MRKEYDLFGGVRGEYAARFTHGSNVVALELAVAELSPDAACVNRAHRALAAVAP